MMAERTKSLKKDTVLQTVWIIVWGILALALAILLVLELASEMGGEDVVVNEQVTVASALVSADNQIHSNLVSGRIANRSAKGITVESLRVTVRGRDGAERIVRVEQFVIPAHSVYILDQRFDSGTYFETVERVEITVDGETRLLDNVSENDRSVFGGGTLLYAAFLVPVVWLLVRASKKRYYLFQESKMVA